MKSTTLIGWYLGENRGNPAITNGINQRREPKLLNHTLDNISMLYEQLGCSTRVPREGTHSDLFTDLRLLHCKLSLFLANNAHDRKSNYNTTLSGRIMHAVKDMDYLHCYWLVFSAVLFAESPLCPFNLFYLHNIFYIMHIKYLIMHVLASYLCFAEFMTTVIKFIFLLKWTYWVYFKDKKNMFWEFVFFCRDLWKIVYSLQCSEKNIKFIYIPTYLELGLP